MMRKVKIISFSNKGKAILEILDNGNVFYLDNTYGLKTDCEYEADLVLDNKLENIREKRVFLTKEQVKKALSSMASDL